MVAVGEAAAVGASVVEVVVVEELVVVEEELVVVVGWVEVVEEVELEDEVELELLLVLLEASAAGKLEDVTVEEVSATVELVVVVNSVLSEGLSLEFSDSLDKAKPKTRTKSKITIDNLSCLEDWRLARFNSLEIFFSTGGASNEELEWFGLSSVKVIVSFSSELPWEGLRLYRYLFKAS